MNGKTYTLLAAAIAIAVMAMYGVNVVRASSTPTVTIIEAIPGTVIVSPGVPIWNPYAPGNLIGTVGTYMPLALYNPVTAQFYPVLAKSWAMFPQNKTLVIYLRHDLYWFNGSAVMPFTAWDVYAQFYIGVKAFGWYVPFLNQSLVDEEIRVLNNYTIEFIFYEWSPQQPYYILTSWIETPWPVWKWAVDALKTMNVTQAMVFGSNNITKFVAPYWALSPYYVTYVSPTYQTLELEPMYYNGVPLLASWIKIFPFEDWYIYPKYTKWWVGGNTQAMTAFLARKANLGFIGLSLQQEATLNASGFGEYNGPNYATNGYTLNPNIYPFNIPQVRQAFCYIINRTAASLAWGGLYTPDPYPVPVANFPPSIESYPSSVWSIVTPCSTNWTKAAQLLESAGLYKKNGQWYLPNGTPLTVTLIAPSGFTDWMTFTSVVATTLSQFGIKTTLLGMDTATYWSTIFPNGEYEMAITWLTLV